MTVVSPILHQFENRPNDRIWIYTAMSESGARLLVKTMQKALGWKVIELPIAMADGLWAVMFENPKYNQIPDG